MSQNKVHAMNSLRTRSLIQLEIDPSPDQEGVIISSTRTPKLQSLLKTKNKKQSSQHKKFRFAQPLTHVVVVENWKRYNSNNDEIQESCCKIF